MLALLTNMSFSLEFFCELSLFIDSFAQILNVYRSL